MADRKKAERHATIRERHPHLGGLILAVTPEPQTTKNWEAPSLLRTDRKDSLVVLALPSPFDGGDDIVTSLS